MSDLYVYAAVAGASVLVLMVPTVVFIAARAWYSGVIEDRDAQIARLHTELAAAGVVIEAAEKAGYIRADEPQGRHAR